MRGGSSGSVGGAESRSAASCSSAAERASRCSSLHGTGGSRMHWRPVLGPPGGRARAARRRPARPRRLDAAARRRRPTPRSATPSCSARMLDELGLDSVHVAGNSVGGWTSLELAKSGRARSVVAIGPAGLWAKRDPWRCVFALWSQHKMGRAFGWAAPPLPAQPATAAPLLMGGTVGAAAADARRGRDRDGRGLRRARPSSSEHLAETQAGPVRGGSGDRGAGDPRLGREGPPAAGQGPPHRRAPGRRPQGRRCRAAATCRCGTTPSSSPATILDGERRQSAAA